MLVDGEAQVKSGWGLGIGKMYRTVNSYFDFRLEKLKTDTGADKSSR